jgi:hypothetical protein
LWKGTTMSPYIFQRGETISLALDVLSGDLSSVGAIIAQLKALPPGRSNVAAGAPVAAVFAIAARGATPDSPAGWTLTMNAATSATLAAGFYTADALINVAGGVIITDQVGIRIRDAVTSA